MVRRFVERVSLALIAGLVMSATGCRAQCAKDADCQSAYGSSCAFQERWCESGQCKAQCPRTCMTVISDVNSCVAGLICTDNGKSTPIPSHCTALVISCSTDADCPLYRPEDDAGAQGAWTCANGNCVYPGLTYAKGTP
jgi:hypothetical protein